MPSLEGTILNVLNSLINSDRIQITQAIDNTVFSDGRYFLNIWVAEQIIKIHIEHQI